MQREQHSCHAEEDEVAEGDVHCCLATPVSRWHQTRDSQSRAALNLSKKEIREISKTEQALRHPQYKGNAQVITSLSCVWSIAKYAGIPAASIPSMIVSMYTRV